MTAIERPVQIIKNNIPIISASLINFIDSLKGLQAIKTGYSKATPNLLNDIKDLYSQLTIPIKIL
jgi:hypothetical protein